MAPKKNPPRPEPESESEESYDGDMGGMDLSRFTNPNFSREFMATLPDKVRNRVKLLLSWDEAYVEKSNAREKANDELRRKYEALYAPLFARRREILTGDADPTAEEIAKGMPEDHKGKVETTGAEEAGTAEEKGLERFWLEALQHHCIISEMISERDEDVLEFLQDVSVATLDPEVRPGFTVVFTFAPNEHFEETSLFKTFYWKHDCGDLTIDTTDQSPITWKEGKDTTVVTVTQKQKSKKAGAVRYVTKTEPCDSFFNFFKATDDAEENEQWCSLAMTIRDKVAPYAVEYFTGEAPDGSSDLDEDEDEEDFEDDDEEEDESEEEMPVRGGRGGRGGAAPARGGAQPPAAARGKDCKQQ